MNSSAASLTHDAFRPQRDAGRGFRAWLAYEFKRALAPRRAGALVALALLPAAIILLLGWVARWHGDNPASMLSPGFYARLFDELLLRTVVFFGCAWLFIQLVRGELTARTLHYAWLVPVRRTRLGGGKFLAGMGAALLLFGGGTLLSRLAIEYMRDLPPAGAEWGTLGGYVGVAALACLGYGAVFFLLGAGVRQPLFPALAFYGWEQINFLLPPWLQRCSIIYYLHALHPGSIPQHEWGFVPPPISYGAAIAWLLGIGALSAWLGVRRFARLEISYGGEE